MFASAVLAAFVGLGAAAAEPPLAAAAGLLAEGRASEAATVYELYLDSHPLAVEGHAGLARSVAAQGRAAEAAGLLSAGARRLLAATRYGDAARLALQATELVPDSASAHQLLGRARVLGRSYREAEPALRRAVELGRRDPQTLLFLGSTLWENGKLAEAESVLRALLASGAAAAPVAAQLGRLLLWLGRAAEAAPLLERALSAEPGSVDLRFALARALDGAGEAERALAEYRRVVAAAPSGSRPRFGLGQLLVRLGDREAGERELAVYRDLYEREQSRTRERGLEQARIDAALDLARQGETASAVAALRRLAGSAEALAALGRVLAAADEHAAAVEALERALVASPGDRGLEALLDEQRLLAAGGGPS